MAKGNHSKGRSYALMLLLAFGTALFGVMLLQKFRERRIFNLLVQEKDRDLFSLQLLLQKERDYAKQLKSRTVEMKAKMYSLRTQKMQADNRILEMQSTIASLQDEQRAMKSGLEEKQNEINMLPEKETELHKENPQVIALTEILKQKDAEIEDLKHRVESLVKVWSVSTDDPSTPSVNLTENGRTTESSKTEGNERKEDSRGRGESVDDNAGTSTGGEGRSENDKDEENSDKVKDGNEDTDRRGMTEEKLQKPDHFRHNGLQDRVDDEKNNEEGIGKKNEDATNEGRFGPGEEKSNGNATEASDSNVNETTVNNEDGTARDRQQENSKFSRENEGQKLGAISEGGVKLKIVDSFQDSANFRVRGRHGYLSNTKGKRWRMIAKNRRLEHNRNFIPTGTRDIRSSRISKAEEGSERSKALTDDHLERSNGHQNRNIDSILNVNLIQEKGKLDISEKLKQGERLRLRKNDQDNVRGGEKDDGSKNITGNARNQTLEDGNEETREQEKSGSHNRSDVDKVDDNTAKAKVSIVEEEPDELEVADNRDSNTNAADGVIVESGSEIEDDREEYREETDKYEF